MIGYLDLHTLDALFAVDPRFSRVVRRNYYMLIMAWLKPTVPLLRCVAVKIGLYCFTMVPWSIYCVENRLYLQIVTHR